MQWVQEDTMRLVFVLSSLAVALAPVAALAKPDLAVEVAVTVPGACPKDCGGPVTFDITITNLGSSACPGTWFTDLWACYPCSVLTHPENCAAASNSSWSSSSTGNVPAGQSITLSETLVWDGFCGACTYLVFVDSVMDLCPEADETNNMAWGDYVKPCPCNEPVEPVDSVEVVESVDGVEPIPQDIAEEVVEAVEAVDAAETADPKGDYTAAAADSIAVDAAGTCLDCETCDPPDCGCQSSGALAPSLAPFMTLLVLLAAFARWRVR
jgi:hypothetical protein